jgi:hypothetical protein
MPSNTNNFHLQSAGISFLVGLLLGLLCASVPYAGALLMVLAFAVAPVIAYCLDLRRKLISVFAIDGGILFGGAIRPIYWRSLHGFENLVGWDAFFIEIGLAVIVSGTMGLVLFFISRIWPVRPGESSERSENWRTKP